MYVRGQLRDVVLEAFESGEVLRVGKVMEGAQLPGLGHG
jgi:hypothetical protein